MPQYLDVLAVNHSEDGDEHLKGVFLGIGTRIVRLHIDIDSAGVANTQRRRIETLGVCSRSFGIAPVFDRSVPLHKKVVPHILPATFVDVPPADGVDPNVHARRSGGAVNDDFVDVSHRVFISKMMVANPAPVGFYD